MASAKTKDHVKKTFEDFESIDDTVNELEMHHSQAYWKAVNDVLKEKDEKGNVKEGSAIKYDKLTDLETQKKFVDKMWSHYEEEMFKHRKGLDKETLKPYEIESLVEQYIGISKQRLMAAVRQYNKDYHHDLHNRIHTEARNSKRNEYRGKSFGHHVKSVDQAKDLVEEIKASDFVNMENVNDPSDILPLVTDYYENNKNKPDHTRYKGANWYKKPSQEE